MAKVREAARESQKKEKLEKLDQEMNDAIEERRWDKLVQFVLEGYGEKLVTKKAPDDEEVQEFIDNVPSFQVPKIFPPFD